MSKIDLLNALLPEIAKGRREYHFHTGLNFLQEHYGLRRGCVHVLLGVPSGGKSTLSRTIIYDFVKNNPDKKVSVWLSEESIQDYQVDLWRVEQDIGIFKNLIIESEISFVGDVKKKFSDFMSLKSELFIFDNITTSKLYEGLKPEIQSEFISRMKTYSIDNSIAMFLVVHTKSEINNQLSVLNSNDVRGAKTVTNMAEYFYILQSVSDGIQIQRFIRIVKHRHHSIKNNDFILEFNPELRLYTNEKINNFDLFISGISEKKKN